VLKVAIRFDASATPTAYRGQDIVNCITSRGFNLRTKPSYDGITITRRLGELLPKESENPTLGLRGFLPEAGMGNRSASTAGLRDLAKGSKKEEPSGTRARLFEGRGGGLLTAQPFPAVNVPQPLG
jgi:hypothetical protein